MSTSDSFDRESPQTDQQPVDPQQNDPQEIDQQQIHLAIAHHQAGRLGEAEAIYRRVLARNPNHADAGHLLGVVALQAGKVDLAAQLIRRAIEINPSEPRYYCNLGSAFTAHGKPRQAIDIYRSALARNLQAPELHFGLGNALCAMRDLPGAIEQYKNAVALRPDFAEAYSSLGRALYLNRQVDDAAVCFQKAVELNPDNARGYSDLGNLVHDLARHDQAMQYFETAISLDPANPIYLSSLICTAQFNPSMDAAGILRLQRRWNDQLAAPLRTSIAVQENARGNRGFDESRTLRIGYVSADFREHVIGKNLLPLLKHHDAALFKVYCYDNGASPDGITEKFQAHAFAWRSIVNMSDARVAGMIREDQIDILVDLSLHLAGNRLTLFAGKPAPIQVTFGGYPGGTGLDAIDYRLSDPYLDPPEYDAHYVEKTIRLAGSFWCYDPNAMGVKPMSIADGPAVIPLLAPNPPPAVKNGFVTFGCLNNFAKVNDRVLERWSRVMGKVKDSRLLLMAPQGPARRHVTAFLGDLGIDSSRLEFVELQLAMDYFLTYHRIEIGLDTLPYNGHTTSLDSLWMGVPVVTLVGTTAVGRAGWSQLCNLKLTDLAAQSEHEFVEIAVNLANDLPRLAGLRSTLRERMENSPLADGMGFARNIESAYRQMWRNWCRSQRPEF